MVHSLVEEVTNGCVVPPDHDRVRLELLPGQDRLVLFKAQILGFPQRLELLVEEREDAKRLGKAASLRQQVELETKIGLVGTLRLDTGINWFNIC